MTTEEQHNKQQPAAAQGRRRLPAWVWFVGFAVLWVVLTQLLLPQRGGLF
jgi:uncharacterized membrane protein YdcZ (DUF606 family)